MSLFKKTLRVIFILPMMVGMALLLEACQPNKKISKITTANQIPQEVPFVQYETGATLRYDSENKQFAIIWGEKAVPTPRDTVPLKLVPYGANEDILVFGRTLISGRNTLHNLDTKTDVWTRLDLGYVDASNNWLHAAFTVGDKVFILVYNTYRDTPSGRRVSGLKQGLDVYQVKIIGSNVELVPELTALPLGGLHVNARLAKTLLGKMVCSQKACLEIYAGEEPLQHKLIKNSRWSSKSLIELASDGEAVFGLFKIDFDDRLASMPLPQDPAYFVCPIDAYAECEPIPADIIPFQLSVKDGNASYRQAISKDDFSAMLLYDLMRMPNSGVANLGDNNYEGVIPWNQVYALNGLVDIATDIVNLGSFHESISALAMTRLDIEMSLIAELGRMPYPWYYAKRYSLDREPQSSVVHLGRIVRLMARAKKVDGIGGYDDVLCDLVDELEAPKRTFEILQNGPNERPELRISRYYPFWADGSNPAWNFQSSWVDGIAYGAQDCLINTTSKTFATRMLQLFIEEEKIETLPKLWNYASGDFLEGWAPEDNISTNTPLWAGDKHNTTTAHMSYRVMDIMALLVAHRKGLIDLPDGFDVHVRTLVEDSWLYPFVSEELIPLGLRPELPFSTARLYARSTLLWEVQNQIWAVDTLVRTHP